MDETSICRSGAARQASPELGMSKRPFVWENSDVQHGFRARVLKRFYQTSIRLGMASTNGSRGPARQPVLIERDLEP
jgi:hypothetical protein